MDFLVTLDLMARGGALALFMLWSWVLVRDHRNMLAAKVAVAMNIAIMGYILLTATWDYKPSSVRFFLALLAGATPGLFWLFARTWFNDKKRIEKWAILLILLSVINIAIIQITYQRYGSVHLVFGIVFRVGMFAFALAGLWEAWRGRDGDLVEARRHIRPKIVAAVGIYVMLIAVVEIAVFNYAAPLWLARGIGSSIAVVTFMFCAAMFGMRHTDLFGATPKVRPVAAPPANEALTDKIVHFMQQELPHRDEEMTIAKLALQLGEQEYRLRRHINGVMGHRNFAAFLNGYRLDEVKSALGDPDQKEVPIITIALDAGFGSLGPFNRAFREAEGMTPSEYRALHIG